MSTLVPNFINNCEVTPHTATLDVTSPHTGQPIARVPLSAGDDVDAAVAAADAAWPAWAALTTNARAAKLMALHAVLAAHADELAALIVSEHGKTRGEARGDEIFGPVLAVLRCADAAEALAVENASAFGNAACVYTASGASAEFFAQRFAAAMIGVNVGVPVPREPFSFGGCKRSRFGACDITGDAAIEFFSTRRKITTKWAIPADQSWMS
ncbi:hypothetical protein GGF38_001085 [Coemansia sp. RSA 25]|nr:hypothetical protein GGF38_001085 [Coemansia sp. RSA 25]